MSWRDVFTKTKQVINKATAQRGEVIYLKDPLEEVLDAEV